MVQHNGNIMASIGYACQLIGPPRVSLRGCTLATATPEKLEKVTEHNLAALSAMIGYSAANNIRLFRISSDIVPLATHPRARFDWRARFADTLAGIGGRARETGQRLSMHPGQYTVLNSPDSDIRRRAAEDLGYHADFLDALGAGPDCRIILHVGGVYGDRAAAADRFVAGVDALPGRIRERIAVENDERSYATDEVCALCARLGLPAVLDTLHFALRPPGEGDIHYWLGQSAATWKAADGRQKIHYSQQQRGTRPSGHSRTIDVGEFLAFHRTLGANPPDIMLEVKDKNLSAAKCLDCVSADTGRSRLTDAWYRYMHAVRERDPAGYRRLREYLKAGRPDPAGFYELIDAALAKELVAGQAVNAADHVWGYFAKSAGGAERRRYERLRAGLSETAANGPMKRFLLGMAERREQRYLLDGLYFDL